MSDPTFTTRAELEAWAVETVRNAVACRSVFAKRFALNMIRRVVIAHMHLPFEEPKP